MNRALWPILIGFTIWSIGFVALYAVQALGCAWGWDTGLHRTVLIVGYFLIGAILVALAAYQRSRQTTPAGFMMAVGQWASVAAFAATALIFAPTLFVSLCI